MTPSGIEPATFWLVEQCLNKLRHRVPSPCPIYKRLHHLILLLQYIPVRLILSSHKPKTLTYIMYVKLSMYIIYI
jgi:hypothetical protein